MLRFGSRLAPAAARLPRAVFTLPRAVTAVPRASLVSSAHPAGGAAEGGNEAPRTWPEAAMAIFTRVARLKLAVAAVALFGGGSLLYFVSDRRLVNKMVAAMERGGRDLEHFDAIDAKSVTVPRNDVHAQIANLIYSRSPKYSVIVGESGTGKSTAVRQVIRMHKPLGDAAIGREQAKDAVYVVLDGSRSRSPDETYAVLLGCIRKSADCTGFIASLVDTVTTVLGVKGSAVPAQGPGSLQYLKERLREAAMAYQKKHGRPMVLVIDAAERAANASSGPDLLLELQQFAKDCADAGLLRIAFVSSEGSVLSILKSQSAWSRASRPLEVGDISDEQAVAYLVQKGVPTDRASDAVATITGGRFALLDTFLDSYSTVTNDAMRDENFTHTRKTVKSLDISLDNDLFKHLVNNKACKTDRADEFKSMTQEKIAALLKANILAAHPDETYTFHSRHVDTCCKQAVFETRQQQEAMEARQQQEKREAMEALQQQKELEARQQPWARVWKLLTWS